jgi:hypothetical protein
MPFSFSPFLLCVLFHERSSFFFLNDRGGTKLVGWPYCSPKRWHRVFGLEARQVEVERGSSGGRERRQLGSVVELTGRRVTWRKGHNLYDFGMQLSALVTMREEQLTKLEGELLVNRRDLEYVDGLIGESFSMVYPLSF